MSLTLTKCAQFAEQYTMTVIITVLTKVRKLNFFQLRLILLISIFLFYGLVIIMCIITFKDEASVELHEDGTIDVISLSNSDVNFNVASIVGSDVEIFNMVNNRLGGCL